MQIRKKQLRAFVNLLLEKKHPLGVSLQRRYAEELSFDGDPEAIVALKEVADSQRIFDSCHKLNLTSEQQQAIGLADMQLYIPTPPSTRLPPSRPLGRRISSPRRSEAGERIIVHPMIAKLDPHQQSTSTAYRYRKVIETGYAGNLTRDQFAFVEHDFIPIEVQPETLIDLTFTERLNRRLQGYLTIEPTWYGDGTTIKTQKKKRAAAIDIASNHGIEHSRTVKTFFQFAKDKLWPEQTADSIVIEDDFVEDKPSSFLPAQEMAKAGGKLFVEFCTNTHWAIAFIDYANKHLTYLDCIPRDSDALTRLSRRILRDCTSEVEAFTWTLADCPMFNADGGADRVLSLLNMIAYMLNLEPSELYSADAQTYGKLRMWLALSLLEDQIPRFTFDENVRSWEDDDETATAVAGCLRQFRDLVRLDSAHVTPDLEREMARRTRDLMADMLSQQHPTTPTPRGHQFGMPTPGTSASPWSTSAEVRERLQTAQREERRTVQVNKFKRIQEEQQERLRRAEEEEQERLRRAAEEEQERANRWRAAQEERRKQADRLEAQNAAAAKARADAAAAAALRAQNQAADRVMLNNFSVQQELNNQNFKQQSHISLRLCHTRASQAMRAFFARAEAQAKAELDQLRAQQDELALASAQQDLDRLILQHDPANQVDAARRAALQEQARQAEEDRLRLEREQAAQAEADRLAAAREAELQRAAAARQADAERLAAEQRAETERQRVRAARQARMDDETALSGNSQLTFIIDQWQADFLQVVHPLAYHTELYRAVAYLWLVDEHSLDIVRKKYQALWNAVLSGDKAPPNVFARRCMLASDSRMTALSTE
ncbi:hypothetical protein KCU83_g4683, partial [Aureobasidium melanogenum]